MSEMKCPLCEENMREPQPGYFAVYCTKPGCPLFSLDIRKTAVARLNSLKADNERLRELVKDAFMEGFDSRDVAGYDYRDNAWALSDARQKALAGDINVGRKGGE